jgi:hypothetical protein
VNFQIIRGVTTIPLILNVIGIRLGLTYAEYKRNQALSKVRVKRDFLLMMDSQQLLTYILEHLRL